MPRPQRSGADVYLTEILQDVLATADVGMSLSSLRTLLPTRPTASQLDQVLDRIPHLILVEKDSVIWVHPRAAATCRHHQRVEGGFTDLAWIASKGDPDLVGMPWGELLSEVGERTAEAFKERVIREVRERAPAKAAFPLEALCRAAFETGRADVRVLGDRAGLREDERERACEAATKLAGLAVIRTEGERFLMFR